MTSSEFHIGFDIQLDKTLDFEYAYVLPEQKDYWLNKAQDRIIKQKLYGNNPKQTYYDITLQRVDDLKTLIKNSSITSSSYSVSLTSYIKQFTLPTDYKYYIKSFVLVDKLMRNGLTSTQTPFPVEHIQREDVEKFLTIQGVNKPDFDRLKGFIEGNVLVVIFDSYTTNVNTCKLTYIKQPVLFNYATTTVTDLPESIHNEILDEAVLLALNNFESQRLQTELIIDKGNE